MIRSAKGHLVRAGLTLVGLGVEENAEIFLHVEIELPHLRLEEFHQFWILGDRRIHHVVNRLDLAGPKHLLPEPIGDRDRKPRVVLRRQPAGKDLPRRLAGLRLDVGTKQRLRLDHISRLGIAVGIVLGKADLPTHVVKHNVRQRSHLVVELIRPLTPILLLLLDRRILLLEPVTGLVRPEPLVVGIGAGLRTVDVGGGLIELLLRPLVEGMVVALRTADPRAQENPDRVVDVVERHARIPLEIPGRRIFPRPAVRREHGMHHLVPVRVLRQRLLDPLPVGLAADERVRTVPVPQDVGPVVEEMAGVVVAAEQLVDQLRALVRLA